MKIKQTYLAPKVEWDELTSPILCSSTSVDDLNGWTDETEWEG